MGPLSKRGSDLAAIRVVIWAVLCGALVECGLCLLWTVGLFGCWAYQGGFSEGLWECTLQDTELNLRFLWLSVRWNGSVNLILTIQHDLWTDLLISILA